MTKRFIVFIDTEIDPQRSSILDVGAVDDRGNSFHGASIGEFVEFVRGAQYVCGHNIIHHDAKYIGRALDQAGIGSHNLIDTLFLSPLLFPTKPYHSLLKDDKLQTEELNNPLNDSLKARDLFYDEVEAFTRMPEILRQIFYLLLKDQSEFSGFFKFIRYTSDRECVEELITERFGKDICIHTDLTRIIADHPTELAYCLSLIGTFTSHESTRSITPPWVLKTFPEVERIMFLLRNKPCVTGCEYCNKALDAHRGLKRFFGYDSYRTYDGKPLQEMAVKAAIYNKSLLAVFPTGGGKSITFQVPALMSGDSVRGLTIVISPLQSLMKDQVDNLEKLGITDAVTINGSLDPIERAKSFERVEDGSASILYLSPESLRSKTIERAILGRKVVRFVIDEAHCFSAWGQDFRVDYLYIADFIKSIQEKKNMEEAIPVSCFTATAKQKVIEDIHSYFKEKLDVDLDLYVSKASRANLHYKVFPKEGEEKYQTLRDLIEDNACPTIVYVSRTRRADELAKRLREDGFGARPYHGKMDKQVKSENQDAFTRGEVQIMVATSAFGMGVDKKDVGQVIHYDISDSLENYVQEAGRAGRDEHIEAECFVLFNEEDLNKHFILLNQTKLSLKEIQQIWKAIKDITRFRSMVSNSALEIARKAGWDYNVTEIETRVTTAIAALENAGYLKRGQNMPRIFANSILSKTAQEAIEKIMASGRFDEKQKVTAIRIIKKLFSSKSRKQALEETAESRVDYISDHLGLVKEEVINIITLLREEHILADTKDLTVFIKRGENKNRSLSIVERFHQIECFLLPLFGEEAREFHIKQLNEEAERAGCEDVAPGLRMILNFWSIKNWIKREILSFSQNHIRVSALQPLSLGEERLKKRYELARFIVEFLYTRSTQEASREEIEKEEVLVEFSVLELKSAYENSQNLFKLKVSVEDVEDTLFYLSRIEAIKIEGGFLVTYNRLTIHRLEKDNKKRYTKEDYQKLNQFYENKVQQIHIVGEYAKKMITDYKEALQFVDDYFQLNYSSFLSRYFRGDRQSEIKRNITPTKFRQLFGELSPTQLKIINDSEARYIVVAAGPGSGKTRVLVHKLASLLLMEDVKHEQLLMLTFSRAAATEFKKRLLKLIGNAANFIEIKTFHSYCFDLLGKVGSLEKSDEILKKTVEKIKSGEVEPNRITKTVLVIDEAQDMNADEFGLVTALMEQNDDMRVIAVGDDDQNIFEFRGANSKYLDELIRNSNAVKYELVDNYRSKRNLVEFANSFVSCIPHRLKETPIVAQQSDDGKLKIVRYHSDNLIYPLVRDIVNTGLSGTTCVLTKTNHEALQVTGLLLKSGMPARLIQSNDTFNLYNLAEVRFFLSRLALREDVFVISDEVWEEAKRALREGYRHSTKLSICENMISDFEASNPTKKYKSDLESFIRESRMEDFISGNGETIFVSTIHKAKGKEFDNVFLLLEDLDLSTSASRRLLYVAMTRAKQSLVIHSNSDIFDHISSTPSERSTDTEVYEPLSSIAMHLTYRDVYLDYFMDRQAIISRAVSGTPLQLNSEGGLSLNGYPVLRFSQSFLRQLEEMKGSDYELKEARVNLVFYWYKENINREIQIILPELYFKKKGGND